MTAVRRLTTILLATLAATTLFAQTTRTQAPRTTEAITAETDRDVNDPRALRLTLGDAVRTAVQQNLGVQLQNYEYRISGQNLRAQYGTFDFITDGSIVHAFDRSPTTNPFQPGGGRSTVLRAGVNQILPTGGFYDVDVRTSRATVVGGGTFVNPQFGNSVDLTFNQPLLRDFGIDITRRGITIARNNLGITEGTFRTAMMDTVYQTEQAYLDLIYSRRSVGVVKESLFLARDQARITQIRIDVGASAPLDILQPRVTIATTEEQLISAVANVRNAEDRLRALLNLPPAEWDRPIVPADDVTYTPMTVDFQQAVTQALANRPEVQQQRLQTENARVQALFTRNQVLPTLDFNATYGLQGQAGRRPAVDSSGNPTGGSVSEPYFDTFSQILGLDYPGFTFGFNVGMPIFNINARANARAAELDLEQSQTFQAQTQQNIAVEVRSAARAVDTFAQTISATRAAREAAERNVEAERKRYENGMTTNFQVLEVQQQLSDARVRELFALVGYQKAVAAFHRAVGDTLAIHNISTAPPERLEEPGLGRWLDRYNWLYYGNRVRQNDKTTSNAPTEGTTK
ncbi:MAG TPA: TolC family protein [Thermoanaerobaculia bacterium]|jgi:HAE1 family hydrophobic/amphiphilic exporter-1|nr:TolC family protein [Thermoanaerobaculia bacterium]